MCFFARLLCREFVSRRLRRARRFVGGARGGHEKSIGWIAHDERALVAESHNIDGSYHQRNTGGKREERFHQQTGKN